MKISYGLSNNNIDVTTICYERLMKQRVIYIPCTEDSRAFFFTDPVLGSLKSMFITKDDASIVEYDYTKDIYIDTLTNDIFSVEFNTNANIPDYILAIYPNTKAILSNIHSQLKLDFGSFNDEYPEQLMSARYLTGSEQVLEIGANIGRNTLVISHILKQQQNYNFVTLECNIDMVNLLQHNKALNGLNFHIESAALSNRKLIQYGGTTISSNTLLPGYTDVHTITWSDLNAKYNIPFDTLVLDCEGAFYYILIDMPEILANVKLIIMENDYNDITHKNYIDDVLKQNGFYVDYSEAGGWGCCFNNFYEVWKR